MNLIPLSNPGIDAPGTARTLGLRPEALRPAEAGLPAQVTHTEPMGREVLSTVDTQLGSLRFLEAGTQVDVHLCGDVRATREECIHDVLGGGGGVREAVGEAVQEDGLRLAFCKQTTHDAARRRL